jgi:Flp pilus assembly protein TadG
MNTTHPLRPGFWRRYLRGRRGAAAVEMALWASVLAVPIYSAVDVGLYLHQRMQLEQAAQAAAQSAWSACNTPAKLPATQNCTALLTAVTAGAQGTSLGAKVAISAGWPSEGYYCVDGSGALQLVGAAGAVGSPPIPPSPFNCSTVVSGSTTAPGDYVQVRVSYAYSPSAPALSVVSLMQNPMVQTAWTRLN